MKEVVAIFGAPRSGTSWLGQLFNSSPRVVYRFQPLFSHTFKNSITERSSQSEIDRFHCALANANDPFLTQVRFVSGNNGVMFNKSESTTHLVWKEVRYHYLLPYLLKNSNIKIIGIVRHPCGVINSWTKAPREFEDTWDLFEEWRYGSQKNKEQRENYFGYEKWKEVASLYIDLSMRYPDRFRVITYEGLLLETFKILNVLFRFCELDIVTQTTDFIESSRNIHSDDPYSVFRRAHNSMKWEEELHPGIIKEILNDSEFVRLNDFYKWEQ